MASPDAPAGTAAVTLDAPAVTSAGIYDAKGRLIRTLWSAQSKDAGPLAIDWNGRTDDGAAAPPGPYTVRVLTHHLHYVWQGVIGNTSADSVGSHLFRAFLPIHDMAFDDAGNGFYVVGYNEGQAGLHRFRTAAPNRQDYLAHNDYRRVFRYVATDGTLVYFANVGLPAEHAGDLHDDETFVIALDSTTHQEHRFTGGRPAGTDPAAVWQSVIDYDAEYQDASGRLRLAASGLAVQRHGTSLFVAHAGVDEVRVFDKHSGVLTDRIAVAGAADLGVAPDDSLWVLCRSPAVAVRHFVRQAGHWVNDRGITEGLGDPLAIGVAPDGTVLVADGSTDQLKAFDGTGRAAWTLGVAGGYSRGGPDVSVDRFGLSAGPTYVAFQSDGSFWFGDPMNARDLHYSASRQYLGEIMYLPHSRVTTVDVEDPTRVFSGFLEFSVDYSKPLAHSWRLVRNWAAGLKAGYAGDYAGLQSVYTLANGATLGVVRRVDLNRNEIVRLDRDGLHSAGATLDFNTRLYPDGGLRMQLIRNQSLQVYERALEGFGPDGMPHWTAPRLLAAVPTLAADDPFYHDVPFIPGINEATYPQTSSGMLVVFNPGTSTGFHLGGIDPSRPGWQWRASPAGPWGLTASNEVTPRDGRYETGNGVQYPGNIVTASGRQIVFGYHGEAWRGGEANQWLHFYDNGLFVGQFGVPAMPRGFPESENAIAGLSGNAFTPQLVTVGGQVYLWHNDESGHGGIHRWWLDGAESIRVLEAPIRP